MNEIKILRMFEEKDTKSIISDMIKDFPRKNKVITKEYYLLTAENENDFDEFLLEISKYLCQIKISYSLWDFCRAQGFDDNYSTNFIYCFCSYFLDFIESTISITYFSLKLFFKENEHINIESFLLFNMSPLEKEIVKLLNNSEHLDCLLGLMESGIQNKINFIDDKKLEPENMKFFIECKIFKDSIKDINFEPVKDLKIYFNKRYECVTNKEVIDEQYIKEKYNITLPDVTELEKIIILMVILSPKRIILFNSIPEKEKKEIAEKLKCIESFCGKLSLFTANEKKPR